MNPREKSRLSVRLAAFLLLFAVSLAGLEAAARLKDSLMDTEIPALARVVNARLPLNEYQRPSARFPRHWELAPGWGADMEDLIAEKKRSGRIQGAEAIAGVVAEGYSGPMGVNQDGFKGPNLDPNSRYPRVLAIGDSVTFGVGGWDWVQAMSLELAREGHPVEAVNGGVEGYGFRNGEFAADRFLSIRPDICVVMLGWNDLFSDDSLTAWLAGNVHFVKLLRQIYDLASPGDPKARALALRQKPKAVWKDDPLVGDALTYRPNAIARAERLGDALTRGGCRVALTTLAGLYRLDRTPDAPDLAIGHLPTFTDNPFVLAAMTARLNDGFRDLAKRKGWLLIDLDNWSRETLAPPSEWFFDSVHLKGRGLELLGQKIARDLLPHLPSTR
jgi:lysophospholipase L1-like esterase